MSDRFLKVVGRAMVGFGATLLLVNAIFVQSEPAEASPNGKCCDFVAKRIVLQGSGDCWNATTQTCQTTGISGGLRYCEPTGVHTTYWEPGACKTGVPGGHSCDIRNREVVNKSYELVCGTPEGGGCGCVPEWDHASAVNTLVQDCANHTMCSTTPPQG